VAVHCYDDSTMSNVVAITILVNIMQKGVKYTSKVNGRHGYYTRDVNKIKI